MIKGNYIKISAIILLVILNVFLIKNLRERQAKINGLKWEAQKEAYFSNKGLKLKDQDLLKGLDKVTLLILFTQKGCSECIRNEVRNINKYFRNLKENSIFYYLGSKNGQNFEYYKRRLPIKALDIDKNLFNGYVRVNSPVAILVDPEGNVYELHKADVNFPKRSDMFYAKMNTFFKAINK